MTRTWDDDGENHEDAIPRLLEQIDDRLEGMEHLLTVIAEILASPLSVNVIPPPVGPPTRIVLIPGTPHNN